MPEADAGTQMDTHARDVMRQVEAQAVTEQRENGSSKVSDGEEF